MGITVLQDDALITGMKLGSAETTEALNSQAQQSGFRHQRRADEVNNIMATIPKLQERYQTAVAMGDLETASEIKRQIKSLLYGMPGFTNASGVFQVGAPGEQFVNKYQFSPNVQRKIVPKYEDIDNTEKETEL